MLSVTTTEIAVHGLELPAGEVVEVVFRPAPVTVDVIVTAPGDEPIFWNGVTRRVTEAAVDSASCRIIPADLYARDTALVRRDRVAAVTQASVQIVSAAAATVSVQRGE